MQVSVIKKQRAGSSSSSSSRLSSLTDRPPPPFSEQKEFVHLDGHDGPKISLSLQPPIFFNHPSTPDVVLFLSADAGSFQPDKPTSHPHTEIPLTTEASLLSHDVETLLSTKVFLHSSVLLQCPYFATVLSDRWQGSREFSESPGHAKRTHIKMTIPSSRGFEPYLLVIEMLYSNDFPGLITDVPTALACLPVAAEWLYDDCIAACVQYLEAVPWTEDEEKKVLEVVTCLQLRESAQLLARVIPFHTTAVEDMLGGLVYAATHSQSNGATVKAFVAKILHDHASRSTVKLVLDYAFVSSLNTVKDSVEAYSSPNVRATHDEIEALQRMNLHTASVTGKHLLWIVERMIELRVADTAVNEWSKQSNFTGNLQRAFDDDAWCNIAPSLPGLVLRCTCRLARAVASGTILASCKVRKKLVKYWLPVLLVSQVRPSPACLTLKPLHQELQDVFLRIISTLPLGDAQVLLLQCLSFATRSMEECSHLMAAFNVWFHRAGTGEVSVNTLEGEGWC